MEHIINYYEANEADFDTCGLSSARDLKKVYAECIDLGHDYMMCFAKPEESNGSLFHHVSCWKKAGHGDFELICRSKHALNTCDASAQIAWMKRVTANHIACA